jgi:hypothetical protein
MKQTPPLDHKNAVVLDRDWLRASLYAKNHCSSRLTPSNLAQANRRIAVRIITTVAPKMSTALNSKCSVVTAKEWLGKMTMWRESTTTSPSGMHLGHHKALIKEFPVSDENSPRNLQTTEYMRQNLLKGQLDLLNYAIKHSYCYKRWKKVATFMIRKDQNSPSPRLISARSGLEPSPWSEVEIYNTPLYRQCPSKPRTIGGLPGKDVMAPVFLEEIQWETTRASRNTLLRMDFDASSCNDRIIPSIARLAARSFGQHQTLCFIHATSSTIHVENEARFT